MEKQFRNTHKLVNMVNHVQHIGHKEHILAIYYTHDSSDRFIIDRKYETFYTKAGDAMHKCSCSKNKQTCMKKEFYQGEL